MGGWEHSKKRNKFSILNLLGAIMKIKTTTTTVYKVRKRSLLLNIKTVWRADGLPAACLTYHRSLLRLIKFADGFMAYVCNEITRNLIGNSFKLVRASHFLQQAFTPNKETRARVAETIPLNQSRMKYNVMNARERYIHVQSIFNSIFRLHGFRNTPPIWYHINLIRIFDAGEVNKMLGSSAYFQICHGRKNCLTPKMCPSNLHVLFGYFETMSGETHTSHT